MIITSPLFDDGASIPKKFSCDGGDMNPELIIENVPQDAKSLALILHDPDAPIEGGFTHWVIWNIDPKTTLIKEESVPPGSVEGRNDAGQVGYLGPCPPSGKPHRYQFKLYALEMMIELSAASTGKDIEMEIQKHVIAEAELTGLYQR